MQTVTVSTTVQAPIEKVWEALWQPKHIIHWCFASDDWHCPKAIGEEPKAGGIFSNTFAAKDGSFQFDLTGQYTTVEPLHKLVYTMGEMKEYFLDAGRVVELRLQETPEGVLVTETFEIEDIHSIDQQRAGWQSILDNFKNYTENL